MMGGYGGTSGRYKDKCYRDTGGRKVTDRNSIQVGEYFIREGKYVAFLQEKAGQKRADLSVDGVHTEVKGMSSTRTDKVADNNKEAFEQTAADNWRYPTNTHRAGQVIILSKYPDAKTAFKVVNGGYRTALKRGDVKGNVFLFHNGVMYKIGGK